MLYTVKLLEFHKRKDFFEQLSYSQFLRGSPSWISVKFKRRPNVTERQKLVCLIFIALESSKTVKTWKNKTILVLGKGGG
jgi:hypothetical protein